MTDFQLIIFEFQDAHSGASFDCHVIVDTKNVGLSIRKVVNLGLLIRFVPVTINVTCIMEPELIQHYFLYFPRFAFHNTPGNLVASLNPTLNYFSKNFKKSIKL